MSNTSKPKDKKGENAIELERKMDELKRQNLQMAITLKKLTEKTIEMNNYNKEQQSKFDEGSTKAFRRVEQLVFLRIIKGINQTGSSIKNQQSQTVKRIILNIKRVSQIQIRKNQQLVQYAQSFLQVLEQYKSSKQKQFDDYQKQMGLEISRYESIINDYQATINERLEFMHKNQQLSNELKQEIQERMKIVADKDREKIQTIDCLKKEMLEKSKQMRVNLLTMRRQQMATNTRLTVLQNQQLLEELQYQSKNTQKILKKKLRPLEKKIQKEIEKELATRTAISKKILKNLNQKNLALQKQLDFLQQKQSQIKSKQGLSEQTTNKETQNMNFIKTLNILKQQIHHYKTKINKLEGQNGQISKKLKCIQPVYKQIINRQSDLKSIMIRFLNQLMDGNVVGQQNQVSYDFSRLKDLQIEKWHKSDIQITVKMLLTFIKPHFTMKNMKAVYFKYFKQSEKSNALNELKQEKLSFPTIIKQSLSKSSFNYKVKSLSAAGINSKLNKNMQNQFDHTLLTKNGWRSNQKDSIKNNFTKQQKTKSLHSSISEGKIMFKQNHRNIHNNQNNNNLTQNIEKEYKKSNKKLIRQSVRQWGKKIKMHSNCSFYERSKKQNCQDKPNKTKQHSSQLSSPSKIRIQ